ncbi:MAG: LysM peptidoglycan-binding domain-containing protein [Lachnospiraceae bacterium]
MRCYSQLLHTVMPGDSLYQLAMHYQTNVESILALNPQVNPYNLQIGSTLVICPGGNMQMPSYPSDQFGQVALMSDMREVWVQHVYWTRMLLISIAERLADQQAVATRLLENPNDIARVFSTYYSTDVANEIAQLLTEHLEIGAALITALRDGNSSEAERLERQWYANADQMARAFSSINPYYSLDEVRNMLYEHLDLTTQEVSMRLASKYPEDIEAFDKVEAQALAMADFFTQGIIRQFLQRFR